MHSCSLLFHSLRSFYPLGACVQWRWARAHSSINITGEGGALAARKGGGWYKSVVCGEVLQAEGEAYAEFTPVGGTVMVGVARAGSHVSLLDGLYATADGWMYRCGNGAHYHNFDQNKTQRLPWASGEEQSIEVGGTVGLLLKQGSLSVHIGGRQVGVMCTGLSGALVWAADLAYGSVRIERKPPPAQ